MNERKLSPVRREMFRVGCSHGDECSFDALCVLNALEYTERERDALKARLENIVRALAKKDYTWADALARGEEEKG